MVLAKKKRPARPKVVPLKPLDRAESVTLTIRASRCETWQHVAILFRLYAETPDIPPLPPVNIAALYTSLWKVLQKLPTPRGDTDGKGSIQRGRRRRRTLVQRLKEGSAERKGLEELLGKMAVAAGRSLPSASFTELVAVARAASSIGSLSSWLWDSIEERSLELFDTGQWRRLPKKERLEDQDWTVKAERSLVDLALLAQAVSLRMTLTAHSDSYPNRSDIRSVSTFGSIGGKMSRFGTELHIPPLLPLDISAGPLLSAQQSPDGKSAAISWSGPSYEWIKALLLASGSCMLSVRQEQKKSRESHPRERTRQSKLFPPSPSPSPPSSPSSYHRPLASLPHSIYVILSLTDPSIQESIDELSPWADLWLATTRPLLPHMSDVDLHRCAIAMRCLLLPLFSERSNLTSWLDAFKQAALHQLPKMGASQIRSLALLLSATENELSAEWRTALDESRLRVITLSREA